MENIIFVSHVTPPGCRRLGGGGGEGPPAHWPSPRRRSLGRGSPEGGSPESGSPRRGSPERGSPERGSPKRGSPERGSPKRGSSGIRTRDFQLQRLMLYPLGHSAHRKPSRRSPSSFFLPGPRKKPGDKEAGKHPLNGQNKRGTCLEDGHPFQRKTKGNLGNDVNPAEQK